jgi:hypothetical protein
MRAKRAVEPEKQFHALEATEAEVALQMGGAANRFEGMEAAEFGKELPDDVADLGFNVEAVGFSCGGSHVAGAPALWGLLSGAAGERLSRSRAGLQIG